MTTQDLQQIKGLIDESLESKLRDQEVRLEKRLEKSIGQRIEKSLEKLSTQMEEKFRQERKYNSPMFKSILAAIKQLEAGWYGHDATINQHEVRITKLEKSSQKN